MAAKHRAYLAPKAERRVENPVTHEIEVTPLTPVQLALERGRYVQALPRAIRPPGAWAVYAMLRRRGREESLSIRQPSCDREPRRRRWKSSTG
jgi:hypothetical protein